MTLSRATPDGTPSDLAPEYYARRTSMGLLITEGTQPSEDGQGYLATPDPDGHPWEAMWMGPSAVPSD